MDAKDQSQHMSMLETSVSVVAGYFLKSVCSVFFTLCLVLLCRSKRLFLFRLLLY